MTPTEKLPTSVRDVTRLVAALRKVANDDEVAHSQEEELHHAVLQSIADGTAQDPQAMAKAALKSRDISFARWCA